MTRAVGEQHTQWQNILPILCLHRSPRRRNDFSMGSWAAHGRGQSFRFGRDRETEQPGGMCLMRVSHVNRIVHLMAALVLESISIHLANPEDSAGNGAFVNDFALTLGPT